MLSVPHLYPLDLPMKHSSSLATSRTCISVFEGFGAVPSQAAGKEWAFSPTSGSLQLVTLRS